MISPGPGSPADAGVSVAAIRCFAGRIPVLGVCLGHQAIAAAFGASVVRAAQVVHGKTSEIYHDGRTLYRNMPNPFSATRYNSLVVDPTSINSQFEISAWTEDRTIMGLRHLPSGCEGVQFHPESILSTDGIALLAAFLSSTSTSD